MAAFRTYPEPNMDPLGYLEVRPRALHRCCAACSSSASLPLSTLLQGVLALASDRHPIALETHLASLVAIHCSAIAHGTRKLQTARQDHLLAGHYEDCSRGACKAVCACVNCSVQCL